MLDAYIIEEIRKEKERAERRRAELRIAKHLPDYRGWSGTIEDPPERPSGRGVVIIDHSI